MTLATSATKIITWSYLKDSQGYKTNILVTGTQASAKPLSSADDNVWHKHPSSLQEELQLYFVQLLLTSTTVRT